MKQSEAVETAEQYAVQDTSSSQHWQAGMGVVVLLMALWMALATWHIPTAGDVDGIGPGLIPGMCAAALGICGCWLIWEARSGGWRNVGAASSMAGMQITPWVWVSAGLLSNALWIAQLGFVLSCTWCYLLAVQGLRRADCETRPLSAKNLMQDVGLGCVLSLLVMLFFTRVLSISLPTLTTAGWL